MAFRFSPDRPTPIHVAGLFAAFLGMPGEAHADGSVPDRRVTAWDWEFDPPVLASLALVTWLYARGRSRRRRSSRADRTDRQRPRRDGTSDVVCFATGIAALLVVLVSPLDPMSDQLASAHMVQHMVMMTVAAPLIILGATWQTCLGGLPSLSLRAFASIRRAVRRWAGGLRDHPQTVWWGYAITMWGWHLPWLYGLALRDPLVHDLQHLSFFVSACAFWQLSLSPRRAQRVSEPMAIAMLFTTTMHATILGVFMTVAPTAWYPEYFGRSELWGLTPLEDQQLAGLIMWMPACAGYLLAAIWLFVRTLRQCETTRPRSVLRRGVA